MVGKLLLDKSLSYNSSSFVQYPVQKMKTTTLTDLRKNLKATLDEAHESRDIVVISRKEDKDMVLLSLSDYESLKETAYLMSNPANASHIAKSLGQIENGKTKTISMKDLLD